MGKIKDALWDWLEDHGNELGFDWDNYPDSKDWNKIRLNKTTAKEYYHNKQVDKWNKQAIIQEDLRLQAGPEDPPEVFEDE